MMPAIRHQLERLRLRADSATHAGLAFGRLLSTHEKSTSPLEPHPYHKHADHVAQVKTPELYSMAFDRWHGAMTHLGAVSFTARTRGPLAIGLGNVSVSEVGLTLHHTYGVPYLPGSALKGLARRAAAAHGLREKDPIFMALFGSSADAKEAGAAYPVFWDGWLEAEEGKAPLQRDVLTVHHKEYYGTSGAEYPTDFDDPNPVPFLSVRPSTAFQVAITCPESRELAELAARLLDYGLSRLGLGGKTNAGYGSFEIVGREKSEAEKREEAEVDARRQEQEEARRRQQQEEKERAEALENEKKAAVQARNSVDQAKGRAGKMTPANVKNEVAYFITLTDALPADLGRELLDDVLGKLQASARLNDKALVKKLKEKMEALQ